MYVHTENLLSPEDTARPTPSSWEMFVQCLTLVFFLTLSSNMSCDSDMLSAALGSFADQVSSASHSELTSKRVFSSATFVENSSGEKCSPDQL